MILSDLLDYETLRIIWWVLLGVLLIAFAAMDGFDLGVDILMPVVGKTDIERRSSSTYRSCLGRQSGLAHSGRRRDIRRLAAALRGVLLRLLSGDVCHPVRAYPAPGRLQISAQA
jgi:hypothetical protein